VFSFSTPYLLDAPYANLHSKVGFVFGALACCSFIFAYLCVPEMKGRSLEEINRMFQAKVPVRDFKSYPKGANEDIGEGQKGTDLSCQPVRHTSLPCAVTA
jgi:hypothetical protein